MIVKKQARHKQKQDNNSLGYLVECNYEYLSDEQQKCLDQKEEDLLIKQPVGEMELMKIQ